MKHYLFDAGHGGKDPGAVGFGIQEKDINLYMALKTAEYLTEGWEGIIVSQTRKKDVFLDLQTRTNLANRMKVDGFVSFHVNAGKGEGFETHVYLNQGVNSSAYKLSESIYNEVIKATGVAKRGVRHTDLHVTRETNMKATLLEELFIDTAEDAAKLKDKNFLNKMALAIATGIAKYEGLKAKKEEKMVAKDVKASDWGADSIEKAIRTGVIPGYKDGKWQPNRPITRADMAVILDRLKLM